MPLVDTHTHLDPFSDRDVSSILARARQVGVGAVISAGTTESASRRAVELTVEFPGIFAGVGIHPMDLEGPVDDATYERLRHMASSTEKVVVVSEIGLDFMEGMPDRAVQYQAFRRQIELARDLRLPIVFHSREAHSETLRVLREERAYDVGGTMHYFQADARTAEEAIDLGFLISLARPLLRLPHLQEVAASLPLEHIVLETDAAPQPFKAKRENWTEPRHLRDVAEKLAQLQERDVREIEEATTRNVLRLFGEKNALSTHVSGGWPAVRKAL